MAHVAGVVDGGPAAVPGDLVASNGNKSSLGSSQRVVQLQGVTRLGLFRSVPLGLFNGGGVHGAKKTKSIGVVER